MACSRDFCCQPHLLCKLTAWYSKVSDSGTAHKVISSKCRRILWYDLQVVDGGMRVEKSIEASQCTKHRRHSVLSGDRSISQHGARSAECNVRSPFRTPPPSRLCRSRVRHRLDTVAPTLARCSIVWQNRVLSTVPLLPHSPVKRMHCLIQGFRAPKLGESSCVFWWCLPPQSRSRGRVALQVIPSGCTVMAGLDYSAPRVWSRKFGNF